MKTTRSKFHIFVLLLLTPFLAGIGVDLYVPSLPAIQHYFKAPQSAVQLTIGVYILGYAGGQFVLGILSDSLGRKKILVAGLFIYTLASLAAVFSSSITLLLCCRALQGATLAGAVIACRAMIGDCFTGLERSKITTYYSTAWGVGPIIGPLIGGYLQHYFNWQADFYFFAAYGLFVSGYASLFLSETHTHTVALHPHVLWANITSIATNRVFVASAVIGSLLYSLVVIFNAIAPFLIQETLHYSPVAYSHMAFALGFGYFLGSLTNRWFIARASTETIVLCSLGSALVVSVILVGFSLWLPASIWTLLPPVFLIFYACGAAFPNIMVLTFNLFPKLGGTAGALFGSSVSAGVFGMTSIATLLNTQTQTPMALLYLAMCLLCFILFKFKDPNALKFFWFFR